MTSARGQTKGHEEIHLQPHLEWKGHWAVIPATPLIIRVSLTVSLEQCPFHPCHSFCLLMESLFPTNQRTLGCTELSEGWNQAPNKQMLVVNLYYNSSACIALFSQKPKQYPPKGAYSFLAVFVIYSKQA